MLDEPSKVFLLCRKVVLLRAKDLSTLLMALPLMAAVDASQLRPPPLTVCVSAFFLIPVAY